MSPSDISVSLMTFIFHIFFILPNIYQMNKCLIISVSFEFLFSSKM